MSLKDEFKDLGFEVLAFIITGIVAVLLMIFTDLSRWPLIIIAMGVGVGTVFLIRRKR